MDFEVISEADIVSVKRGRRSNVSPELVAQLKSLKKGQAMRVNVLKCDPTSESYKNDKSAKSATLRQAGKEAGREIQIRWTPEGVPQVVVVK